MIRTPSSANYYTTGRIAIACLPGTFLRSGRCAEEKRNGSGEGVGEVSEFREPFEGRP